MDAAWGNGKCDLLSRGKHLSVKQLDGLISLTPRFSAVWAAVHDPNRFNGLGVKLLKRFQKSIRGRTPR